MTSTLMEIVPMTGGDKVPLLMEVPLPTGIDGPFLITGQGPTSKTGDFLWIEHAFPGPMVRVSVRKQSIDLMSRNALMEIARRSVQDRWGSTHPPTREGVQGAISHLLEFELGPVEILTGGGFDLSLIPEGMSHEQVSWVPEGWAVALPAERSYVGTVFDFGQRILGGVVHNASRSVGVISPRVLRT